MKLLFALILLSTFVLTGCFLKPKTGTKPVPDEAVSHSPTGKTSAAPSADHPVVTPSGTLNGKVTVFNDAGRFVVLEFPVGRLPGMEQRLFVYREGLKVGEVRVTGPQRDVHVVADLTAGEAKPGDEVRDK